MPACRSLRKAAGSCLVSLWMLAGPALAQPQEFEIQPGEEATVDLSGNPQDEDDTALRIQNRSNQPGIVNVEFDPKAGLGPQESVAEGFALVDGTLIVTSNLPPGQLRARYRIEAGTRFLRRAGIRVGQQRVMRRDPNLRWRPAIRALRAGGRVRYRRDVRADFVLGHHGFHLGDEYAWAVIDVNSRYAVGGLVANTPVPSLGPLGLVALGGALLWAAVRLGARRRA